MLLFGHLGITLGIFLGLGVIVPKLRTVIDPRYLAIGALLPDLIDKPVGEIIFFSTFGNGRIIAHTLLFSVLLFMVALYMYDKKRDIRGFSLVSGSFLHLFEDVMPSYPRVFFWPLFGWSFPKSSKDFNGVEHIMDMFVESFHIDFLLSHTTEILIISAGIVIGIILTSYCSKKKLEKKSSN